MVQRRISPGVKEYLAVSHAAAFLGVTHWTPRNWDRAGKLKPYHHPLNGYRLYRREDLDAFLKALADSAEGVRRAEGP